MAYRGSKRVVALKRGVARRCAGRKFPNGDTDHWTDDERHDLLRFLSRYWGLDYTDDEWRDIDDYILNRRRWDAEHMPKVRHDDL